MREARSTQGLGLGLRSTLGYGFVGYRKKGRVVCGVGVWGRGRGRYGVGWRTRLETREQTCVELAPLCQE